MPGLVRGIDVFKTHLSKQGVDGRDEPGHDENYSPFHPHVPSNSRICVGTGALTVTAGLFLKIGTVISRACRCSVSPPLRGALP